MTARVISTAISAFALLSTAAFAADLPRKSVAPVFAANPAFSWTGFYAGVHAGYGFGETDWRWLVTPRTTKYKPAGFLGGGQAGFNFQVNQNFLVGIEGNLSLGNIGKTTNEVFFLGTPVLTITDGYKVQARWFGDVSARAGVTFDRLLIFAKGGVAMGDFKYTNNFSATRFGAFSSSVSHTHVGYLLGAGVEYAIASNWTAKVEYNYIDFGSKRFGRSTSAATLGNVGFKTSLNVVKAGLNYKF